MQSAMDQGQSDGFIFGNEWKLVANAWMLKRHTIFTHQTFTPLKKRTNKREKTKY